jgi:hypothetical protein
VLPVRYELNLCMLCRRKLVSKTEIMTVGIRRADHATPRHPQKLELTSLTSGGRSVGIVRSQTEESRSRLWSSGQSSWLQVPRSGFDSQRYQIF